MRIPRLTLNEFKHVPSQILLKEKWQKAYEKVRKNAAPDISKFRANMEAAKAKFDESKSDDDWKDFCYYRGKLAGKISGVPRSCFQVKKLVFIEELLKINKIDELTNYTLIQFISKQIDDRGLDKEVVVSMHSNYKEHKVFYEIPEEEEPFWETVRLAFSLNEAPEEPFEKKKIVKI